MVQTKHKPYGLYERFFKRALDIFCSLMALLVFWWLYVIVAILVRVKLGSPVLFTQDRPGKDEKIFKLYKFRTMTDARDENGNLLPDDVRLTKFGKLLRSTSLDELPEVFNILKGDMSIIGPAPCWSSTYLCTMRSRSADMRCVLAFLAMPRSMDAIACPGKRSSAWMWSM